MTLKYQSPMKMSANIRQQKQKCTSLPPHNSLEVDREKLVMS